MGIFFILLLPFIVKAEECNIINNNGVVIDCAYYNDLLEYYDAKLVDNFTQDEFDSFKNNDLDDIEIESYLEVPSRAFFQTNYKRIEIVKNGSFITMSLTWLKNPVVRSHDVFAARFTGSVAVNGNTVFRQFYTTSSSVMISTTASKKTFSNGFGYSFKLSNYSDMEIFITYSITGSGSIYTSYQHATTTTSLTDSKKYTLSSAGYGNVILFDSSVENNYDNMSGVHISV